MVENVGTRGADQPTPVAVVGVGFTGVTTSITVAVPTFVPSTLKLFDPAELPNLPEPLLEPSMFLKVLALALKTTR